MKTEFVDMADHLRQKGRQEGSEHKNRIATQNILQKGFDYSINCEVIEVSPEFVEKVRETM